MSKYSSDPWKGVAKAAAVKSDENFLGLPFSRSMLIACTSTLALGMISGSATRVSVKDWYPTLKKPNFNPPNLAFPIAWTVLYLLQGVAAHKIWEKTGKPSLWPISNLPSPLKWFGVQFVLNLAWSPLFFGMKKLSWAMIDISAMWLCIVKTIDSFNTVDKTSAQLLIPYLGWVSFASYLNFGVMKLNPEYR